MKAIITFWMAILVAIIAINLATPATVFAQKKGKGDLEDFTDDYDEDESDSEDDDSGTADFFFSIFINSIDDIVELWGGTPDTEFGRFPAFPYAENQGFLSAANDYRSYFFTTELNYHMLNEDLRAYLFKWETQFVHKSKLSFDMAVYEEDRIDEFGKFKDHLTFYGFRYGYAVYQSPQMIANLEVGFRGFHRHTNHGGPELALDLTIFPKKPLIFEMELAAAYIGNGALYTAEASAGFALGRFEILGGFRVLKNKDSDLLDGARVGVRFWY